MPSNEISNFNTDKKATLLETQGYLKDNPSSPPLASDKELADKRSSISNKVFKSDQDFDKELGDRIRDLEELRDLRLGITTKKIELPAQDTRKPTSILVRDARGAKDTSTSQKQSFLGTVVNKIRDKEQKDPLVSTEAFEMQYLNVVRAARDIAGIEGKPELCKKLEADAQNFIKDFHNKNKNLDQKGIRTAVNTEIAKVVQSLSKAGIENARDKVNTAKDFQNLKDEQSNIVTLSSLKTKEGKTLTAVEAEVGLRGLTEDQKAEYTKVENHYRSEQPEANKDKLPAWFNELQPFEKELCHRNIGAITNGQHVISTQLRQIVGMKNTFEKTTALADAKGEHLEVLKSSKHAGTIASFARGTNEVDRDKERARITQLNASQAQEWVGEDRLLHCVTLNSAKVGTKTDVDIVNSTVAAMNHPANDNNSLSQDGATKTKTTGRATNLAYNMLRMSRDANIYDGLKESIANIKENINVGPGQKLDDKLVDKMVASGQMGAEVGDIAKDVIKLEKMVKKTESALSRIGLNNFNADIEVAQTNLMDKVAKAKPAKGSEPTSEKKGLNWDNITAEESVVMCASGKDRTGFAQHDGSARAIESAVNAPENKEIRAKLGINERDAINIDHIDKQFMDSRHTATMAGSIHAGGASIGAFGTKKDNIQSLIRKRFKNLANIIAVTASGNNIPSAKKIEELAQKANKTAAKELANKTTNPLAHVDNPKLSLEQNPNQTIGAPQQNESRQQLPINSELVNPMIKALQRSKPLPPIPEQTAAIIRPTPPVPNKPLPPIPEQTTAITSPTRSVPNKPLPPTPGQTAAITRPTPPVPNKPLPPIPGHNNSMIDALKKAQPHPPLNQESRPAKNKDKIPQTRRSQSR